MTSFFTIAAFVLLAILAVKVLIKTIKGLRRGGYIEVCKLLITILSAVIALFIVKFSEETLFRILETQTMEDLLTAIESVGVKFEPSTRDFLLTFSPESVGYVLTIPVTLLLPIVFCILYMIIKILLNLGFYIIKQKLYIPQTYSMPGRSIGAALGAIEGVIATVVLFVPLITLLTVAHPITSMLNNEDPTTGEIAAGIEEIEKSPALKVAGIFGGNLIADQFTTIGSGDDRIDVVYEINCIADLVKDIAKLATTDTSSSGTIFTEESEKIFDSMLSTLDDSEYMCLILSDGMHVVSKLFLGDTPAAPADSYDKLIASVKELLDTSTRDTVVDDITTAKDFLFFFNDHGVLGTLTDDNSDSITEAFVKKDAEGNTLIKSAIGILQENPRTTGIVTVLNELTISLMFGDVSPDNNSGEMYENVKGGFQDLVDIDPELPPEEYKENVKNTLDSTLTDNGINLEPDVLDSMSEQVTDYLNESRANGTLPEEIGDAEVTDIILTYYEAFLSSGGSTGE